VAKGNDGATAKDKEMGENRRTNESREARTADSFKSDKRIRARAENKTHEEESENRPKKSS
jgi:hypothetical protein